MTRVFPAVIVCACLGFALSTRADDDPAKIAITDIGKVDADFAFQGEYASLGWGLQVVSGGDGKFEGMLYRGGLPGSVGAIAMRTKLAGSHVDNEVKLRGGSHVLRVLPSHAQLYDNAGRQLARLGKTVRTSRTLGMPAPRSAEILFNGAHVEHFKNGKLTSDGLLDVGTMTKQNVGDFRLHLEFRTPYMPHARGQARANSGVYIQQRYEVQILDSFGLEGIENECGSLYKQQPPRLNMALPPLAWQTYDIWFRQPRWTADGKTKIEPARITVLHNGVPVQWDYAITNKTGGGKPEGLKEFPIALQDHGNPVAFRNIWIVTNAPIYTVPLATSTTNNCAVATPRRLFRHRCRRVG